MSPKFYTPKKLSNKISYPKEYLDTDLFNQTEFQDLKKYVTDLLTQKNSEGVRLEFTNESRRGIRKKRVRQQYENSNRISRPKIICDRSLDPKIFRGCTTKITELAWIFINYAI